MRGSGLSSHWSLYCLKFLTPEDALALGVSLPHSQPALTEVHGRLPSAGEGGLVCPCVEGIGVIW